MTKISQNEYLNKMSPDRLNFYINQGPHSLAKCVTYSGLPAWSQIRLNTGRKRDLKHVNHPFRCASINESHSVQERSEITVSPYKEEEHRIEMSQITS
jgi:hypothetical protein